MTSRNTADRVRQGEQRKPEGQGHPGETDPKSGKPAASTALPHPTKTSQNVPMNSAPTRRDRLIFIYVLYVLLLKADYRIVCHRVALIPAQAVG